LKLFTLSIDIDTLAEVLYEAPLTPEDKQFLLDATFHRILPRVLRFLSDNGINATFFLIGKYSKDYRNTVLEISKAGHEIGNHTYNHLKNFSRIGSKNIFLELINCHEIINDITGRPPVGFRAPGYTINSTVLNCLKEMDYQYDASVIPSWSYQSLKMIYRLLSSGENIHDGTGIPFQEIPEFFILRNSDQRFSFNTDSFS
jgi:peptidoglycan/xylan/chitin deacetylase (PgdA/CDA1 family)